MTYVKLSGCRPRERSLALLQDGIVSNSLLNRLSVPFAFVFTGQES